MRWYVRFISIHFHGICYFRCRFTICNKYIPMYTNLRVLYFITKLGYFYTVNVRSFFNILIIIANWEISINDVCVDTVNQIKA